MSKHSVQVKVFRYDPARDADPYYLEYAIPFEPRMSAMNALDFIYHNIDSTLSYYDHAGCSLGICGRCVGRVNGKTVLLCQTAITGDTVIEPVSTGRTLKDLVMRKGRRDDAEPTKDTD